MPYMKVSLTKKITQEEEEALVRGLGEAICTIPGKEPRYLDAEIDSGKTIYRGGVKQENFAYVDIRYLRCQKFQVKKDLAKAVFKAINAAVGTAEDKMCLSINEYHTWGGFGDFIDEFYTEDI